MSTDTQPTILLVDDEDSILATLNMFLEMCCHSYFDTVRHIATSPVGRYNVY